MLTETRATPAATAEPIWPIVLELLIVAALAAAFLVLFRSRPGYVDVLLAIVAVGFILGGYRRSARLWSAQRLDAEGEARLRRAAIAAGGFTLAALVVLLAIGLGLAYRAGGIELMIDRLSNPRILGAALLYLPWALLQQFVFQFYLLGRLLVLLPVWGAIGVTALAFSLVHFPRLPVMVVTLVAGALWALIYRRYRSLLPLAVSHALLGSALHYWVFGRDLLANWLGAR
jgi:membrane protease YdiL (CAAX protease family)